jgi:hypothetical protein
MAEYVGTQKGNAIAPSQWKQKPRENFLHVVERVYSKNLGIPAFPDPNERMQIDQLREIRNAIIHHNGSVKGLPQAVRAAGPDGFTTYGLDYYADLHDEFVIPNADFLRRNFKLVERHLDYRKRLDNHVLPFGSMTRHLLPRVNPEVHDEERWYDGVATRGAGAFGESASARLVD